MSINPVSAIGPVHDLPADANSPVARRSPNPPASPSHSGTESNREISRAQRTSEPSEMPQDEVQVQRDPAGSGQIVIKYLDAKGNLVLQVPSSQLLGLARAIEQTFNEQARDRAAASEAQTAAEQGAPHGN